MLGMAASSSIRIAIKVKHPKALHICPGKPTAEYVREKLGLAMPNTAFEAIELLARYVKELQDAGVASTVATQQDLIPVLAADMKRKAGGGGSDDQWNTAAKQQIESNQTTALTTPDDRYTGLANGAKFDEIHELVHICSGKGGESAQQMPCLKFNEGAVNYFAELIAPKLGATVVTRYKSETGIAKKFAKLLDANATKRLIAATFQGKIDDFFTAVGAEARKLPTLPNGKPKGFTEKGWTTDQQAGQAYQQNVKNWSETWLNQRLPNLP
jgi:hypothetical protein